MKTLTHLTTETLLEDCKKIAQYEKKVYLRFLDYLQEVDRRAAFVSLGFHSLYQYLTDGLGYSHEQTYLRINAIRIMNKVPEVKEKLKSNVLTLSTLATATTLENLSLGTNDKIDLKQAVEMMENKSKTEAKEILEAIKNKPKKIANRVNVELNDEEYELLNQVLKLKNTNIKNLLISKCKYEKKKLGNELLISA